jgi:hypothetical protein
MSGQCPSCGVQHGTPACYWAGCRCDDCRAANRLKHSEGNVKRRGRLAELRDDQHGRLSTYCNWGCRCDRCTAANAEACRAYYESHRDQIAEARYRRKAKKAVQV